MRIFIPHRSFHFIIILLSINLKNKLVANLKYMTYLHTPQTFAQKLRKYINCSHYFKLD